MERVLSILVVEDDGLVALDLETLLTQCRCVSLGPAGTVDEALDILQNNPVDGAVLDINLHEEKVWPVAALLADYGIPFLFVSGYEAPALPAPWNTRPVLSKPVTRDVLHTGLKQVGVFG